MGFRSAQKEKSATEGLQKVEFREVLAGHQVKTQLFFNLGLKLGPVH